MSALEIIGIIFVVLVVIVFTLTKLFPLVEVCGDSMNPTYVDGDYVLTKRVFFRKKVKVGDVLIFKCPRDYDRLNIKRVDDITYVDGKVHYYFLGDNSSDSYDSRNYGFVSKNRVYSKVIKPKSKIVIEEELD